MYQIIFPYSISEVYQNILQDPVVAQNIHKSHEAVQNLAVAAVQEKVVPKVGVQDREVVRINLEVVVAVVQEKAVPDHAVEVLDHEVVQEKVVSVLDRVAVRERVALDQDHEVVLALDRAVVQEEVDLVLDRVEVLVQEVAQEKVVQDRVAEVLDLDHAAVHDQEVAQKADLVQDQAVVHEAEVAQDPKANPFPETEAAQVLAVNQDHQQYERKGQF